MYGRHHAYSYPLIPLIPRNRPETQRLLVSFFFTRDDIGLCRRKSYAAATHHVLVEQIPASIRATSMLQDPKWTSVHTKVPMLATDVGQDRTTPLIGYMLTYAHLLEWSNIGGKATQSLR